MDNSTTIDVNMLDSASYYLALAARDARFDGVFFTGVKTTGVYCRPVCSAKTPLLKSCEFFTTAAAAEQAGFRPCLRCRPELAPYAVQQNLAYGIWQKIAAGALNDGNVEQLSAQVGLSSRQLRRVLQQHFGVTPIELAQTQRLLFSKKLLQETSLSMTEIAFIAGFGSVRRFNALFVERYRLAPSALRSKQQTRQTQPAQSMSPMSKMSPMSPMSPTPPILPMPATQKTRKVQNPRKICPDDGLRLRLAYRPPFDWPGMLHYLAPRALLGIERIDLAQSAYLRSIRFVQCEGWMRVTQDRQKHQLCLELSPALAPVLMPLLAQVRQQFDLDANPRLIEAHLSQDRLFAAQLAAKPGLRVPGAFDVFELGLRTILGQQVSVAGATTLSARLVSTFGDEAQTPWPGIQRYCPSPARLLAASVNEIAQIGIPLSRAGTIRNFAQFALQGGLLIQPGTTLEQAVLQMQAVPGIGPWSAHYIALRGLRFPDAFPAGDLGLQKFAAAPAAAAPAAAAPAVRLTEKALLIRAKAWSPWRAYAAMALWQGNGHESPAARALAG